jgi:2-C-methyl-D-erythritol 2,4-cyclodiphosphate synthase
MGFDSHRFCEGRTLVLGGEAIHDSPGLDGHSDADVLSHAIADAMLGAVAEGDIGAHFPDTDKRWKDACSLDLLTRVSEILAVKGARVIHVDSTVIAEKPRLAGHIGPMRRNLASAIGISAGRVSVKATTAEQMGALGRGEGIAVLAVATIEVKEYQMENGAG